MENKLRKKALFAGAIILIGTIGFLPGLVPFYCSGECPTPKILKVDNEGDEGAYTRIQDAIDDASSEDTIYVYSGTYYENVVLNKTLTLVGRDIELGGGDDTGMPVVDGMGKNAHVINVCDTADLSDISNFIIRNSSSDYAGLYASTIVGCFFIDNAITKCGDGIRLNNCNSFNILDNNITGNYISGISLKDSTDIRITDNKKIDSNWNNGIQLFNSSAKILRNSISNNTIGIFLSECTLVSIRENNVSNNRYYGLHLLNSSNNNISGDKITNNEYHGILLSSSISNDISLNYIAFNIKNGISLLGESFGNDIYDNDIKENGRFGIFISGSCHNNIFNINFIGNKMLNAFDGENNNWDNGYYGNYWSDYIGVDEDNNGIGDTPYSIPGGENKDHLPFMNEVVHPINNSDFPVITEIYKPKIGYLNVWAYSPYLQVPVTTVVPTPIKYRFYIEIRVTDDKGPEDIEHVDLYLDDTGDLFHPDGQFHHVGGNLWRCDTSEIEGLKLSSTIKHNVYFTAWNSDKKSATTMEPMVFSSMFL